MWLDDLLGVTARLDSDRLLRARAEAAGEGEVWTCRLQGRDRRGNRAVSWIVGPVTVSTGGGKQVGGQDLLEPQAFSRAAGARRPRLMSVLSPGEGGAPPRPPYAGAEQFGQVPAGTRLVVEYTRPGHAGVRFLDAGTCGYLLATPPDRTSHRAGGPLGQTGRCVGNVWVDADAVVGLVHVDTDQYEAFETNTAGPRATPIPALVPGPALHAPATTDGAGLISSENDLSSSSSSQEVVR